MSARRRDVEATRSLDIDGRAYRLMDLGESARRLPYVLKILLENAERRGRADDGAALRRLATDPDPAVRPVVEFSPARVVMQDFTALPALIDLAAMREAAAGAGAPPAAVNPQIPVDLVIDHSLSVDHFGTASALALNTAAEYERNAERYAFFKWAQQAFTNFRVVPPGNGIVHQVNLEYLATVVSHSEGVLSPDTVIGTDSHTTMINGVGVLGWGVGGIEAEVTMLGHPLSIEVPPVTGVRLSGRPAPGTTATDVVLALTQALRSHGVVGHFVEFFGPGLCELSAPDRATISNMSPEFGSTCALFPIDEATLDYLRLTGRPEHHLAVVEAYAKAMGLWHDATWDAAYTQVIEVDLAAIAPCVAGPTRPQDQVPLDRLADVARAFVEDRRADTPRTGTESWSDGAAVIAAITSCTNTSNPRLLVTAALVAKAATELGLTPKPWVKTSFAPGSRVVADYLERAGLLVHLEKLGFNVAGFGCTTCAGNSGPLVEGVSERIAAEDLTVAAVLSGNRNFEARIHPDVRMGFLASPPLVVAFSLLGRVDVDPRRAVFGVAPDGTAITFEDLWPSDEQVDAALEAAEAEMDFDSSYRSVFDGDEHWRALPAPDGELFDWDPHSTYVRRPPFFSEAADSVLAQEVVAARALVVLGDSVTTDHISPAGAIPRTGPAGLFLRSHGVEPRSFNIFGARRGNHEVMMRGTFANVRLRNRLADPLEGGVTRMSAAGEPTPVYEAATSFADQGIPLIVIAGRSYGSGSSRDWAAKGTRLLGVAAVIAESFERIHRSNLIGMGVLPLEFAEGESFDSWQLTGFETFVLEVGRWVAGGDRRAAVRITVDGREFWVRPRVDTDREMAYLRAGGVLRFAQAEIVRS